MTRKPRPQKKKPDPQLPLLGGLVLTRREGQEIVMPLPHGGEIVVRQLAEGRLCIKAPAEQGIYRRELWDRIQQQKPAA